MIKYFSTTSTQQKISWEEELNRFRDANLFQSDAYRLDNHSKTTHLFRSFLVEDSKVVSMAQGKIVIIPIFKVACLFLRGGPVFHSSSSEKNNNKNLKIHLQKIKEDLSSNFNIWYLNIVLYDDRDVSVEIVLREAGLTRPQIERDPYLTSIATIKQDSNENLMLLDSKWRNQLRKAEKQRLLFTFGSDQNLLKRYTILHNEMSDIKKLKNISITGQRRELLINTLGESLQVLVCSDGKNDFCGCVIGLYGTKSYYIYAAANELGRANCYSNAMVWELLDILRKRNINELDLMGLDPVNNWGSYNFKKGIGGKLVASVGEWEAASNKAIKLVLNIALYWKIKK